MGHRCFLVAVICRIIKVKISIIKLGSNAKPTRIEINSGLRIIYDLIFCKQKGHFIWIGLNINIKLLVFKFNWWILYLLGFGGRIWRLWLIVGLRIELCILVFRGVVLVFVFAIPRRFRILVLMHVWFYYLTKS